MQRYRSLASQSKPQNSYAQDTGHIHSKSEWGIFESLEVPNPVFWLIASSCVEIKWELNKHQYIQTVLRQVWQRNVSGIEQDGKTQRELKIRNRKMLLNIIFTAEINGDAQVKL